MKLEPQTLRSYWFVFWANEDALEKPGKFWNVRGAAFPGKGKGLRRKTADTEPCICANWGMSG